MTQIFLCPYRGNLEVSHLGYFVVQFLISCAVGSLGRLSEDSLKAKSKVVLRNLLAQAAEEFRKGSCCINLRKVCSFSRDFALPSPLLPSSPPLLPSYPLLSSLFLSYLFHSSHKYYQVFTFNIPDHFKTYFEKYVLSKSTTRFVLIWEKCYVCWNFTDCLV